jgi:hypothetical protein
MSISRLSRGSLYFLFFIWPFASFLLAAGRIVSKQYQGVILLFSFLFGYSVYLYSGDILDYERSFYQVHDYSWDDFLYLISHVLSADKLNHYTTNTVNQQPDIYALTLQFLVSRFTDNPRWFWAIVSLLYTYIFLKFINEVALQIKWTNKWPQKIFFLYLALVIPFYVGVTGVRFWTALFFFMVFAMRYVRTNELKYIFIAALSTVIHYSFLVPLVLLFAYRYIKISRVLTIFLVLLSLTYFSLSSNTQMLGAIQSNLTFFGETTIGSRAEGYSDVEIFGQRIEKSSGANWYKQLQPQALHYFLTIVFLLEFFGLFKWRSNAFLDRLYPFIIIFFCLALLSFSLGSIGRFKNIFYLATLFRYTALCGLNPDSRSLRNLSYIIVPILFLHVMVSFRGGFYYVDPLLLIGNPVVLFLVQSGQSLSEFLIGH